VFGISIVAVEEDEDASEQSHESRKEQELNHSAREELGLCHDAHQCVS
jgi:hypothetical protein